MTLTEANAWQAIETAPRNGQDFLAWDGDGNGYVVMFWSDLQGRFTDGRPDIHHTPTHWRHLPPAPEAPQ